MCLNQIWVQTGAVCDNVTNYLYNIAPTEYLQQFLHHKKAYRKC